MYLLMSRVQAILAMTQPSLIAEEKYFLIRLLAIYNHEEIMSGGVVGETIAELEKCLGMSDKLIKKVRDGLTVKNHLTNMTVSPKSETGQGRPRAGFSLSKEMIKMLDVPQSHRIHEDHIPRIEQLLLWRDKGSEQQKSITDLKPANRILLAVLYSQANSCGMVTDLGVMRLAKLSGLLTRDRIECQLNKLKTLDYLIDHVSGMTGKYLLGATEGAFFLNVFKAGLSNDRRNLLCLQVSSEYINFLPSCYSMTWQVDKIFQHHQDLRAARSYYQKVADRDPKVNAAVAESKDTTLEYFKYRLGGIKKWFLDNQVFSSLVWRKTDNLPHLFLGVPLLEEGDYWISYFSERKKLVELVFRDMNLFHHRKLLQHKINCYASVLLSKHWHEVTQTFVLIEDFMGSIEQDLFPTKIREKLINDFGQQTEYEQCGSVVMEAVVLYFYRLVFETALLTKGTIKYLCTGQNLDISHASYTILSVGYNLRKPPQFFQIHADFRNNSPSHSCIKLNIAATGELSCSL